MRIELLERDGDRARYRVFDGDGREVSTTHRDVSMEIAEARRRKLGLVAILAEREGITLDRAKPVAVIPRLPDAPVAADHTHEEFAEAPEPEAPHEHADVDAGFKRLETLLDHVLGRVQSLEQSRLISEKTEIHWDNHETEFGTLTEGIERVRRLVVGLTGIVAALGEDLDKHKTERNPHKHEHEHGHDFEFKAQSDRMDLVLREHDDFMAKYIDPAPALESLRSAFAGLEGAVHKRLADQRSEPPLPHSHALEEVPHEHPAEHVHYWVLNSEEDTAGRHRRIYKCWSCGQTEVKMGE